MPPNQSTSVGSGRTQALAVIALMTAIRLVIAATTPLTDSESYYAIWGRFPSWSYYDHPPLLAWLLSLVQREAVTPLALRLVPILCAAWFGWLVYRLGERMFSPRAGLIALSIVTVIPAFFVNSIAVSPAGPLAPLWVLALLQLWSMRDGVQPWRPALLGAVVGLAFLAEFTGLLLVPVIVLWLSATPVTRRWWSRPSLMWGAVIALLVAMPVLWWNAEHGWPSLELRFVERLAPLTADSLRTLGPSVLLKQIAAYHPLVVPVLIAAAVFAVKAARTDDRCRLLALASVPVLLFLLALMMRVRDAGPQTTLVAWVPLAGAAAGWLDARLASQPAPSPLLWHARVTVALSAIAFTIGFVHLKTPLLQQLLPDAAAQQADADVSNELYGWEEIAPAIREDAADLGDGAVVASCQHALCAQLMRRLNDSPRVFCPSANKSEFDFLDRRDPPEQAAVIYVDNDQHRSDPLTLMPRRSCRPLRTISVGRGGPVTRHYRLIACTPAETLRAAR
ncbi:MAG: glycosyltransferase family 39 protein [Myxococcaceae bacterium]